MTLNDVPRNDLDAALKYYQDSGRTITPEEYQMLYMLQDNPAGFRALSKGWTVEVRHTSALDEFNR